MQDNAYYDINFAKIGNQFIENNNKNITKMENKAQLCFNLIDLQFIK